MPQSDKIDSEIVRYLTDDWFIFLRKTNFLNNVLKMYE